MKFLLSEGSLESLEFSTVRSSGCRSFNIFKMGINEYLKDRGINGYCQFSFFSLQHRKLRVTLWTCIKSCGIDKISIVFPLGWESNARGHSLRRKVGVGDLEVT